MKLTRHNGRAGKNGAYNPKNRRRGNREAGAQQGGTTPSGSERPVQA